MQINEDKYDILSIILPTFKHSHSPNKTSPKMVHTCVHSR